MPALLHCVNTHIIPNSVCNGNDSYNGEVLRGNFCAGEWGVGGKDGGLFFSTRFSTQIFPNEKIVLEGIEKVIPEKDACQGDSGGPLTIGFTDESVGILVGATSWGYQCGLPKYPGVYTDIAMFMDWVNDKIN